MTAAQQLITDNIDIWTAAIKPKKSQGRGSNKKIELYGIKKLRELILELAVRGLLVPQDPSDEPASELLKRIAAEKAQLIKIKAIKKPKKLPHITDDEKFLELPNGWEFVRLNDLGEWGAGATPSRRSPELYGGNIPWFKSGELSSDYISSSEETVTEIALKKSSLRYNKVGDVLIAMYGATIGKTSILGVRATTNQAVCACTPFAGLANTFLLTLLKAYKSRFVNLGAGGAQPNISREKIISTIAALPPTAEQHRIVAKVGELMALCDQLEQQTETSLSAHQTLIDALLSTLTNTASAEAFNQAWQRIAQHFDTLFTTELSIDQLKQNILQLAVMGKLVPQDPNDEPASKLLKKIAAEKVQLIKNKKIKNQKPLPPISDEEKPFELPVGWEWCRLDDVALKSEAGWSPQCLAIPAMDGAWGVLKVSAVSWGYFKSIENKQLPENLEPKIELEVKPGDFLISRANTAELVARGVVVPKGAPENLMMSDKIIRFVFSKRISSNFVNLLNSSNYARGYYAAVAGGTSSSMKNVTREQIRSLVFGVPSLEEQSRILVKVDELMTLCDQLKARLNDAQTTQLHLADSLAEQALS